MGTPREYCDHGCGGFARGYGCVHAHDFARVHEHESDHEYAHEYVHGYVHGYAHGYAPGYGHDCPSFW